MVNTSGVSTSPLIIKRCWPGSISATPEWCRSNARPLGVMIPSISWSGVKLTELTLSAVNHGTLRRTTWASYWDGMP
jgi:hypothetical protein